MSKSGIVRNMWECQQVNFCLHKKIPFFSMSSDDVCDKSSVIPIPANFFFVLPFSMLEREKGGTNISMWMLSKTSQTLLTKRSPKFHYFSTYRFPFSFHTQQLFQKCAFLHLVKGSLTWGRGVQWIIYPTPVSRHERKGISQGMWTDDFFVTSCKP